MKQPELGLGRRVSSQATRVLGIVQMAIQFACPSCEQPIEIDDEHGADQVSCPYCRNVVTAPTESTLHVGAEADTGAPVEARPLPPDQAGPLLPEAPALGPEHSTPQDAMGRGPLPWALAQTAPAGVVVQPLRRNVVGIVGIIGGMLALVLFFVMQVVVMSHWKELGIDLEGPVDQAEVQKRLMEKMQAPEQHMWVVTMTVCFAGAGLSWAVGLICSVIGISRRYRGRGAAIAGLIVALILPLLLCAGLLIQL